MARALTEQNRDGSHKLQGETDKLVVQTLRQRSAENDLATLRRRNIELLGQIHALDDAKMMAEKAAREAMNRGKALQEKLDLFAAIQNIDLGRMQVRFMRTIDF